LGVTCISGNNQQNEYEQPFNHRHKTSNLNEE
jgi:hypothetical protein